MQTQTKNTLKHTHTYTHTHSIKICIYTKQLNALTSLIIRSCTVHNMKVIRVAIHRKSLIIRILRRIVQCVCLYTKNYTQLKWKLIFQIIWEYLIKRERHRACGEFSIPKLIYVGVGFSFSIPLNASNNILKYITK